jgi:hypothetical protein
MKKMFKVDYVPELVPRYNIAPAANDRQRLGGDLARRRLLPDSLAEVGTTQRHCCRLRIRD